MKKAEKERLIITVNVINFPDGTTFWFEQDFDTEADTLKSRVDKWWNNNPEYKDTGVDMVFGSLRMLREDYDNITADINA